MNGPSTKQSTTVHHRPPSDRDGREASQGSRLVRIGATMPPERTFLAGRQVRGTLPPPWRGDASGRGGLEAEDSPVKSIEYPFGSRRSDNDSSKLHSSRTTRTLEALDRKHPVQEIGPRPPTRGLGSILHPDELEVGLRRPWPARVLGDDLCATCGVPREDPMVEDLIHTSLRHESAESLKEFEACQDDFRRAIRPGPLQAEPDVALRGLLDTGPGKRRAKKVPTQPLQPRPVPR